MGNKKIHLLRIVEVVHRDAAGRVVLKREDLSNVVHSGGERFMLGVLFAGEAVPELYRIGLDARTNPSASEVMADIYGLEPSDNGYERQAVSSREFSMALGQSGAWRAEGPTVLFRASGGSWGPVKNVFLCTGADYQSSVLVSSVPIGQELTVQDGETVTMRMAMSLSGC